MSAKTCFPSRSTNNRSGAYISNSPKTKQPSSIKVQTVNTTVPIITRIVVAGRQKSRSIASTRVLVNTGREVQVSATEVYHHFLMNWKDEEKRNSGKARREFIEGKSVMPDNAAAEVSVADWELAAS